MVLEVFKVIGCNLSVDSIEVSTSFKSKSSQKKTILVLTADTLTLNSDNKILGKPKNRDEAIAMLSNRNPVLVGTGFCLDKKEFDGRQWHTIEQIVDYDQAYCTVDIPPHRLDFYLSKVAYLKVSGSFSVGGFGDQFVKEVVGNYSAIIGLPMYQLRKGLEKMDFFK